MIVLGDWYERTDLPNGGTEVVRVVKISDGEVHFEDRNYIANSFPHNYFSTAFRRIVENFTCLTCAFTADIDLSDMSGRSDDAAEQKHTRHDGAHRANWYSEVDGNNVYERRLQRGIDTDHVMEGEY